MKAGVASVLAALASGAAAQKIQASSFNAESLQASSAPNAVPMSVMKEKKMSQFQKDKANGLYDEDRYEASGAKSCADGKAGEYSCNKVELLSFLRHQDLGSTTREGNDVWGMLIAQVTSRRSKANTIVRLDRFLQWSRVRPPRPI